MINYGRLVVTHRHSPKEKHQPEFTVEEKYTAEAQMQQIAGECESITQLKNEKQVFEKMYIKYCKAN